jgi:hypothetical protein
MDDEKLNELPCRSGRVSEPHRNAFGKPFNVCRVEVRDKIGFGTAQA